MVPWSMIEHGNKKCKNQGVLVRPVVLLTVCAEPLCERFPQKKFRKKSRNPNCSPSVKNSRTWSFEVRSFGVGRSALNDHPLMMMCLCTSIF